MKRKVFKRYKTGKKGGQRYLVGRKRNYGARPIIIDKSFQATLDEQSDFTKPSKEEIENTVRSLKKQGAARSRIGSEVLFALQQPDVARRALEEDTEKQRIENEEKQKILEKTSPAYMTKMELKKRERAPRLFSEGGQKLAIAMAKNKIVDARIRMGWVEKGKGIRFTQERAQQMIDFHQDVIDKAEEVIDKHTRI